MNEGLDSDQIFSDKSLRHNKEFIRLSNFQGHASLKIPSLVVITFLTQVLYVQVLVCYMFAALMHELRI